MTAFRIPEGSFLKPVDHKIFYSLFENEAIYDIRTRVGRRRSKEIYNLLEPHRKLFGNRALDLACGAGLTSFVLEELGLDVTAVDIQESMIEKARLIAKERKSKVKFLVGDILSLNIKDEFSSIFLLGNSILHFNIKDFVKLVKNSKQWLSSQGVFVIEYQDSLWKFCKGEFSILPYNIDRRKVSVSYNPIEGQINYDIQTRKLRDDLVEAIRYSLYIWTPWIISFILKNENMYLILREANPPNLYLEIWKKEASGGSY